MPKWDGIESDIDKHKSEKRAKRNNEYLRDEPVMFDRVEVADELIVIVADFGAFNSWVTVWNAGKIHVCVRVSANKTKHVVTAVIVTGCSCLVAAGSLVAGEEFDN